MKAIIVDMDDQNIIILNKKGDFKRIDNKNISHCRIGQEIEVPDRKAFFAFPLKRPVRLLAARKVAAILAALILMVGMGGYCIADYFNPVTFVTMDINPSLELTLNRYERVLKVDTFNDGGDSLAPDAGSFRNMKLEDAVKILVDRAESENYLNPSATLMLTVSSKKESVADELDARLKEVVLPRMEKMQSDVGTGEAQSPSASDDPGKAIGKNNVENSKPPLKVIVEKTTMEKHEEAIKMNMSQGKFLMYEKLKKVNPDVTPEDVKKVPVSGIIEELKKSEAQPSDNKKMNFERPLKGTENNGGKQNTEKGLQKSYGQGFKQQSNQENKIHIDQKARQQNKINWQRQDGKTWNNEKIERDRDKTGTSSRTTGKASDKLVNLQEEIKKRTSGIFNKVNQDLIKMPKRQDDNKEKGREVTPEKNKGNVNKNNDKNNKPKNIIRPKGKFQI